MPGRVALRPFVQDADFTLYCGDALEVLRTLPDESVDACVTSPPYLDARPEVPSPSFDEFEAIFRELRRVVSGHAIVNVGRMFRDGMERLWWVELIEAATRGGWAHIDTGTWIKPNANPIHGAVFADRHEYLIVLGRVGELPNIDDVRVPYAPSSVARMRRGWINHTGVKNDNGRQAGRRKSEPHPLGGRPPSYIICDTGREKGNPHPTPMPANLAADLVALAAPRGATIIDPFCGSGTTALAARRLGRNSIGIERDPEYAALCAKRLQQLSLLAG